MSKADRDSRYYLSHVEAIREKQRAYYLRNREQVLARQRARREETPEKPAAAVRRWKRANRERVVDHQRRRRARALNSPGTHTFEEWVAVLDRYGRICLACGVSETERKLEADHVVPLAKGGADSADNLQPLCGPCNRKKSTKTLDFRPG